MRALKENARQGFWNGSLPPIGYRVVAAEQRGAKIKKKLEIDPLHAETVRPIYRLALHGDGDHGQMGVKNIVSYLNGHCIFTRDSGRWGIGQVQCGGANAMPTQGLKWRMGWDSNPRWTCAHASFQDWSHKPLGHPSSPNRRCGSRTPADSGGWGRGSMGSSSIRRAARVMNVIG